MNLNTQSGFRPNERQQQELQAAPDHATLREGAPETLRVILGVGRSGTTWVSRVLSKTRRPVRFLMEPLFHLEPRLPFHASGDHTAVGYEMFSPGHPLLSAYRRLTERRGGGSGLKGMEREDPGWELCLVKEVHALLGTEGLLRAWNTPALLLLRDPVYVVDSLFAAQTLQTIYLDHEVEAVQQGGFLNRFVPGRVEAVRQVLAGAAKRETRERLILTKVICTQLLQEMLIVLGGEFPYVKLLRYEKLCEAPAKTLQTFQAAAQALSIPWDSDMEANLGRTMQADASSSDPYSIMRNTVDQKTRPFAFLTGKEVGLCRAALAAMGA